MKGYTIRVYAIIEYRGGVILSDECIGDVFFTKFPGGGHEWGEGIADTVIRELREEMNVEVEEIEHFYTTDFFVTSKFDEEKQVVSVYYRVKLKNPEVLPLTDQPFDFDRDLHKAESFRCVPFSKLTTDAVTFPIDKKVVNLFKRENQVD